MILTQTFIEWIYLFIFSSMYLLLTFSFLFWSSAPSTRLLKCTRHGMVWDGHRYMASVYQHQNPLKWKDWIGFLCHKGLDIAAGKSNWQATATATPTPTPTPIRSKATASVWILWLNYQRMMFWWFHLHISAIRREQRRARRPRRAWRGRRRRWTTATNRVGDIV